MASSVETVEDLAEAPALRVDKARTAKKAIWRRENIVEDELVLSLESILGS